MLEDLKRLELIYGEWNALYHEVALALHMADSEHAILYSLSLFGGTLPLTELRKLAVLPKQTLHSALRKLEKKGLVQLEAISALKKRAELTEAGQKFAAANLRRLQTAEQGILNSWTKEERSAFLNLSERYVQDLRKVLQEFAKEEDET